MKMNRLQWLAQFFRPFARPPRKPARRNGARVKAVRGRWLFSIPGEPRILKVDACTRSEARAAVKQELGIKRKRRLPAGIEIIRQTVPERAAA